jgi:hypothetical protein
MIYNEFSDTDDDLPAFDGCNNLAAAVALVVVGLVLTGLCGLTALVWVVLGLLAR